MPSGHRRSEQAQRQATLCRGVKVAGHCTGGMEATVKVAAAVQVVEHGFAQRLLAQVRPTSFDTGLPNPLNLHTRAPCSRHLPVPAGELEVF